jgi:hypothetical protein
MTLSEKIARGEATDAEVALALGFYHLNAGGEWCGPGEKGGYSMLGPPPLQTCLTTLAKECERRGLNWSVDMAFGRCGAVVNHTVFAKTASVIDGTPTPALALCAAIVAAVERNPDDR